MARPSATAGAPAVSGKGGRQGRPGEPSSLGRALGASFDSVTCRRCDLGELTSPLCALGSLPEKNVGNKLCPVGLSKRCDKIEGMEMLCESWSFQ